MIHEKTKFLNIFFTRVQHISSKQQLNTAQQLQQQQRAALSAAEKHLKQMQSSSSTQQITAAMLQQQNRAALVAQQSLDKYNSMASLEKQRMYKQFDKKQYDAPHLLADSRAHVERSIQQPPRLSSRSPHVMNSNAPLDLQQPPKQQHVHKVEITRFNIFGMRFDQ